MVNLPAIPPRYADTAQKLLAKQPLVLVLAHLIHKASEAEQKAEEAIQRASESDKRVRHAVGRIGELKSMLERLTRLQTSQTSRERDIHATPDRQGLPYAMSFGGNVIDTPGPNTFQEQHYHDEVSRTMKSLWKRARTWSRRSKCTLKAART